MKNDKWWEFSVYVIVFLIATWLRVHDLVHFPPGIHFDEAANGLLAGDIGLRGAKPLFIEAYTGKEVLFFYIAGFLMFLLGEHLFVLRLAAALIGIVTIAATVWLCHELFPRKRLIAIFASILLSTDFVMILFSRLGFRAITQPLFQTLTIAAFLYALRTKRWQGFAASGLFLGLTGYSYLAARLFPLVVMIMLALWLWGKKIGWRSMLFFLTIGLITIAPLLAYFSLNPDRFWVRIGQLSGDERTVSTYLSSYVKSMSMLVWHGDPYWRFNIPFRPLLSLPMVVISLAGVWMMQKKWQPLLLIIFSILIMLLPTALAIGEIIPSNLRSIGIFPFILLPAAYAVARFSMLLPVIIPIAHSKTILTFCALIPLLLLTNRAIDNYFNQWGTRDDVFYETNGDLVAIAAYLDQQQDIGSIFVASKHYQHPSLAFATEQYDNIHWLVDAEAFVQPTVYPALYIFPSSTPIPAWIDDKLSQSAVLVADNRSFIAYQLDQPILWRGKNEISYQFGDVIDLVGYTVERPRDDQIAIMLHWHVNEQTSEAVIPFIHLESLDRYRWSQNDSIGYLAEQWNSGDAIIYHISLSIPPGMPTDDYQLRIGLFDGEKRLALQNENGRFAGTTAVIPITLSGNQQFSQEMPPSVIDQFVLPNIRLLGSNKLPLSAETGEIIPFELWWVADDWQDSHDNHIQLNWVSMKSGEITMWNEHHLMEKGFMIGRHTTPVPLALSSGRYMLQLQTNSTEVNLGQIQIIASKRLFVQPDFDTATEAIFNEQIRLVGYSLNETELTLIWQAIDHVDIEYTVFIHMLDENNRCCIWQSDAQPMQNKYPTTRWLPNEFIIDRWPITAEDIATGSYPISIGLYNAETGNRLQITDKNNHENLDDSLFLSSFITP